MKNFRPAPDGQPTESIKTMLEYAQRQYEEAIMWEKDIERKAISAHSSVEHWRHARDEHEWQLEQREATQEVTGL